MLPWLAVPLTDGRLRQQLDGAYRPVHFHPPIEKAKKTKDANHLLKSGQRMKEMVLAEDDHDDDDAQARDRPLQVRGKLSAGMMGERRGSSIYYGDLISWDWEKVRA